MWSKFISCALPSGPDAGVIFLAETSGGDTTAKNKRALRAVESWWLNSNAPAGADAFFPRSGG